MSKPDAYILRDDFVSVKRTVRGVTLFNNCDVTIGKQLNEQGEWAEYELQLFEQILKPGMSCIDVGAHIGTHTVAMAQMVAPDGIVHAFEPQRIPFQMLNANVMLNAIDHVFTYRLMVGASNEWRKIGNVSPRVPTNHGGFTPAATLPDGGEGQLYTDVGMCTLDSRGFHAVHLIKIDVEGAELDVLTGAKETIRKFTPIVYFEANERTDGKRLAACVDTFPPGYKFYWHVMPSERPDNYYGAPVLEDRYVEQNLIAVPETCTFNGFVEYVYGETAIEAMRRVKAEQEKK